MHVLMRESWTDERLDEFGKRMDERFDGVDRVLKQEFERVNGQFERVNGQFEQVNGQFEQVNGRLNRLEDRMERVDERLFSMGRTMVAATVGICTTMIAGFGAVAAAIVATL